MSIPLKHKAPGSGNSGLPPADTGNASNPSPADKNLAKAGREQLLDEKAETYIREGGAIEDLPDAADMQDMDETLEKENP